MTDAEVRRLAPRDWRAPTKVERRSCPRGEGCLCCVNVMVRGHGRRDGDCKEDHPAADRTCYPPVPEHIPACAERRTLAQDPPDPPAGFRPLIHACCIECGRITARRWNHPVGQLVAWCGGQFPPHTPM